MIPRTRRHLANRPFAVAAPFFELYQTMFVTPKVICIMKIVHEVHKRSNFLSTLQFVTISSVVLALQNEKIVPS